LTILASAAFASGQVDPTFVPPSGAAATSPLALSPDGRIAQGGRSQGSLVGNNFPYLQVLGDDGANSAAFTYAYESSLGSSSRPTGLAFDAAGRLVVAWSWTLGGTAVVARYRSDGRSSATFDRTDDARSLAIPTVLVLDAASRPILGGTSASMGRAFVARLHEDGGYDGGFGTGGEVALGAPGMAENVRLAALGPDPQGGIVVVHGTASRLSIQRLDSVGGIDPTFGTGGVTMVDGATVASVDRLGRAIVAKVSDSGTGSVLLRFVDGRPDPAFGAGGSVPLAAEATALATDAHGRIYAGWVTLTSPGVDYRVVRLRSDGTADAGYGIGGVATASLPLKVENPPYPAEIAFPPNLAVDPFGRLVMAAPRIVQIFGQTFGGNTTFFRFTGDAPPPPATALAVEFVHAGFGHYFTTADADEIAALDAGAFDGWTRTGESFAVLTRSTGHASPACRFFSGSTFAPKSSHFYTPYPGECDNVGASPSWAFEKLAYQLQVPEGFGDGNGTCPADRRALYRAYNGMQGGAPNHRYTTNVATLEAMLAVGWQFEGEANTRVFACVPP
jgi:hypothetical protein